MNWQAVVMLSFPLSYFYRIFGCFFAGIVTLRQDYKICEKDNALTPEQAQILVISLYYHLSIFNQFI